jgi:hypothetical protein
MKYCIEVPKDDKEYPPTLVLTINAWEANMLIDAIDMYVTGGNGVWAEEGKRARELNKRIKEVKDK